MFKILHVASFRGNVGDNANHNGLRRILTEMIGDEIEFTNIEMRNFYNNYDGDDERHFDLDFARLANRHDMLIFGGGNFFEIWLEHSSTGCTIDIPTDVIETLQTKVLFFGLGFDTYKGYSESTKENFLRFIMGLQDPGRFLVSVRNDGSLKQFVEAYGTEYERMITKVPDGGFFLSIPDDVRSHLDTRRKNIVISIAMDMPHVRYGAGNEVEGHSHIVRSFASYTTTMCDVDPEIDVTFMPHIYSDLEIVFQTIDQLPQRISRRRVTVGPCISGMGAENAFFANYRDADLIVGMRFHANVCGVALNVPTIGVSTYKKITDLYSEIGLPDNVLDGSADNLATDLIEKSYHMLEHAKEIKSTYFELVRRYSIDVKQIVRDFIEG